MKDQKKVNLIADIVAPFGVIAATIALFFIFIPAEPGPLFWTNLVYLVVLETILFAYIAWLPRQGSSVVLKWLTGVYTIIYIVVALIWLLLFSTLLYIWFPVKVYYAGIMVITALWIFISAITVKIDNHNEIAMVNLSDNRHRADVVTTQADMLISRFNLLIVTHGEKLKDASPHVISLCHGLSTISPVVMADSFSADRIIKICSDLEQLMSVPVSDEMANHLKTFSENSLLTLNSLKKSARK